MVCEKENERILRYEFFFFENVLLTVIDPRDLCGVSYGYELATKIFCGSSLSVENRKGVMKREYYRYYKAPNFFFLRLYSILLYEITV